MLKYYFIPRSFENLLSQLENDFLNRGVEDSYTCITGVYKISQILDETDNIVYNQNILKQKTFIKNGYLNENQIFQLFGFCLEADFDLIAPEYNELINQFTDILQFTSSQDYLIWYNNL